MIHNNKLKEGFAFCATSLQMMPKNLVSLLNCKIDKLNKITNPLDDFHVLQHQVDTLNHPCDLMGHQSYLLSLLDQ